MNFAPITAPLATLLLAAVCVWACQEPTVLKTGPECNYHWERKAVHVCILGMPPDECAFLFRSRPEFVRDAVCVCRGAGDRKETMSGGYRQLSCR